MPNIVDATTEWVRLVGLYPGYIPDSSLSEIDNKVRALVSIGMIHVRSDDESVKVKVVTIVRPTANVRAQDYRVKTQPELARDCCRVDRFLKDFKPARVRVDLI
ncbi:hypothetical protein K8R03_01780 [Candidatus Kaiserbacteria bacterium]|nr:hypothetical protein [Candidatus Kaiserbacteria bacterium]